MNFVEYSTANGTKEFLSDANTYLYIYINLESFHGIKGKRGKLRTVYRSCTPICNLETPFHSVLWAQTNISSKRKKCKKAKMNDTRGGSGAIARSTEDSKFTATSVTIAPATIIHPMGEIRTIWDELCKYCVGDNRRVELLA